MLSAVESMKKKKDKPIDFDHFEMSSLLSEIHAVINRRNMLPRRHIWAYKYVIKTFVLILQSLEVYRCHTYGMLIHLLKKMFCRSRNSIFIFDFIYNKLEDI